MKRAAFVTATALIFLFNLNAPALYNPEKQTIQDISEEYQCEMDSLFHVWYMERMIKHYNYIMDESIFRMDLNEKFTPDEQVSISLLALKYNIPVWWLYTLFYMESGFDLRAVNDSTGASGLIQIMPGTAKSLNTTTEDIMRSDFYFQIRLVEIYLDKNYPKGGFKSFLDLYLAVLYPMAIDKDMDYLLGTGKILNQNLGIDRRGNNDKRLTKYDVLCYTDYYLKAVNHLLP